MTASEGAPVPWEIWHARFNFDDRGYKFRPVLILACSPDKETRPRPTIQGRGRGCQSVRSARYERHSHSMVAGGLEVTSRTTRLTSGTELVMRVEMRARTS